MVKLSHMTKFHQVFMSFLHFFLFAVSIWCFLCELRSQYDCLELILLWWWRYKKPSISMWHTKTKNKQKHRIRVWHCTHLPETEIFSCDLKSFLSFLSFVFSFFFCIIPCSNNKEYDKDVYMMLTQDSILGVSESTQKNCLFSPESNT